MKLRLVAERDHIEGSFTTAHAIWADRRRIYLASQQGTLFVLARDRAAGFPVVQTIQLSALRLTAVSGDAKHVYVVSDDGLLHISDNATPLAFDRAVPVGVPGTGVESLVAFGRRQLYAGGGELAVDKRHVFTNRLNESNVAWEFSKLTWSPGLRFAGPFTPDVTEVYDRRTGRQVASIPNPPVVFPRTDQPRPYVDNEILAITSEGRGITLYDPHTFAQEHFLPIAWTNGVVRRGRWLIEGNESGAVRAFDLRALPDLVGSAVDLPALTGHTRIEDIEIRSLWTDHHDGLIFAGSSWGNQQTRGPDLPSFFVLELARTRSSERSR